MVAELTPDLTDPDTDGPLSGRERQWALYTPYRIRIARRARDLPTAQKLQELVIARDQQQAATALAAEPRMLDADQRRQVRNLATDIFDLGQILREQGNPGCVDSYLEATRLLQMIGDRHAEGVVAFNLGHAYKDIPSLRDLAQAEHWYRRRLELAGTQNSPADAKPIAQLGAVSYERFLDDFRTGQPAEQLARHLTNAIDAYEQALSLVPANNAHDLAAIHNMLGILYAKTGEIDRALTHYRQSIHYREQEDDRYGAGETRYNAAVDRAQVGRNGEALLYAQAALRDVDAVGAIAHAERVRKLIASLEQE